MTCDCDCDCDCGSILDRKLKQFQSQTNSNMPEASRTRAQLSVYLAENRQAYVCYREATGSVS